MQDRKISFSGSMVLPLAAWFLRSARDLPWRKTKDPYRIWVSEIMLQQTRVEAVKAYYERFLQALPDIPHLAECPEDDLLKLWEGLGYYSRVRNLQKAARQILERHGGAFPGEEQEILDLPGIGSYTCGAVGSIAFGLPLPAVDGNVLRVCGLLIHRDCLIPVSCAIELVEIVPCSLLLDIRDDCETLPGLGDGVYSYLHFFRLE